MADTSRDILDKIKSIRSIISYEEDFANNHSTDLGVIESEYRSLIEEARRKNEIDETLYNNLICLLNKMLGMNMQIAMERINLLKIREKVNKVSRETTTRNKPKWK